MVFQVEFHLHGRGYSPAWSRVRKGTIYLTLILVNRGPGFRNGCFQGLTAKISYVSPKPEFTPPVIYSRKSRDRLVFLVEAVPGDARNLAPGLPVEVTPLTGIAKAAP